MYASIYVHMIHVLGNLPGFLLKRKPEMCPPRDSFVHVSGGGGGEVVRHITPRTTQTGTVHVRRYTSGWLKQHRMYICVCTYLNSEPRRNGTILSSSRSAFRPSVVYTVANSVEGPTKKKGPSLPDRPREGRGSGNGKEWVNHQVRNGCTPYTCS